MNPPQKVINQDVSLLFKLAIELRNEIYAMVFAAETNQDNSIDLEAAKPPSKALVMTCRVLRSETNAMYRAAYQNYPKHTFVLNVGEQYRSCGYAPLVPAHNNDLFAHMVSVRLHWQADESNTGDPQRFTSHLDRHDLSHQWTAQIQLHDKYWREEDRVSRIERWYETFGSTAMERFRKSSEWPPGRRLSDLFAAALAQAMGATPARRSNLWALRDYAIL